MASPASTARRIPFGLNDESAGCVADVVERVTGDERQRRLRPGIEDRSFQQWTVNANDDASRRGVNSTPTVFVNGEAISGSSIEDLFGQVMQHVESGS